MARLSDLIAFPTDRTRLNGTLRGTQNRMMLELIGQPRSSYDQECRSPTNQRIANMMRTVDFGPFRATGLAPATEVLLRIMAEILQKAPQIHAAMSTAGMLCCRLVRGSRTSISNHSWGTAIDIKLEGKLDTRGDDKVQRGLLEIHPIFNKHGFYWGAAFPTEDAMHFEASEKLVRQWAEEGRFGDLPVQPAAPAGAVAEALDFGDRGQEVAELQRRLNLLLGFDMDTDGIFGRDTRAAVMEFQRANALKVDGIAGRRTMKALDAAEAAVAAVAGARPAAVPIPVPEG